MPAISPRVLKDAENVDHTFAPSSLSQNLAVYTELAVQRFADRPTLTEQVRPADRQNEGHKLVATLSIPSPVVDQDGCCVNKDMPPISRIKVDSLISKFATSAQADDLIAEFRSYVSSAVFADLVKGGSNY